MMQVKFKKGRIPFEKLRVLKLGDETQLHLEHARKMKLD